jgi:hypothetical protein
LILDPQILLVDMLAIFIVVMYVDHNGLRFMPIDARTLRQSLKSALTIGVFGNQKAELLYSPGLTNS